MAVAVVDLVASEEALGVLGAEVQGLDTPLADDVGGLPRVPLAEVVVGEVVGDVVGDVVVDVAAAPAATEPKTETATGMEMGTDL